MTFRWKWHDPTFASLMLGRIELAQISLGRVSNTWFYTLRFTQGDERVSYSAPTLPEAKGICIIHANKVLEGG